jgi:hypothetical protein
MCCHWYLLDMRQNETRNRKISSQFIDFIFKHNLSYCLRHNMFVCVILTDYSSLTSIDRQLAYVRQLYVKIDFIRHSYGYRMYIVFSTIMLSTDQSEWHLSTYLYGRLCAKEIWRIGHYNDLDYTLIFPPNIESKQTMFEQ